MFVLAIVAGYLIMNQATPMGPFDNSTWELSADEVLDAFDRTTNVEKLEKRLKKKVEEALRKEFKGKTEEKIDKKALRAAIALEVESDEFKREVREKIQRLREPVGHVRAPGRLIGRVFGVNGGVNGMEAPYKVEILKSRGRATPEARAVIDNLMAKRTMLKALQPGLSAQERLDNYGKPFVPPNHTVPKKGKFSIFSIKSILKILLIRLDNIYVSHTELTIPGGCNSDKSSINTMVVKQGLYKSNRGDWLRVQGQTLVLELITGAKFLLCSDRKNGNFHAYAIDPFNQDPKKVITDLLEEKGKKIDEMDASAGPSFTVEFMDGVQFDITSRPTVTLVNPGVAISASDDPEDIIFGEELHWTEYDANNPDKRIGPVPVKEEVVLEEDDEEFSQ